MEDTGRYKSPFLAQYLVAYGQQNNYYMNMTKLQKLLFISYGLFLAWKGERLVDEHPQAWPYGPVFPTTRNKLLKMDFAKISIDNPDFDKCKKDADLNRLLGDVFQYFGNYSTDALVEWTHQEGSPWYDTRMSSGFKWGERIQDDSIKKYFEDNLLNPGEK